MEEQALFPNPPIASWEKADSKGLGRFCLSLYDGAVASLRPLGKGTVEGTQNIIEAFEELFQKIAPGDGVRVVIDMHEMNGSPLRAQMLLGRWLLKRRQRIVGAAIVGGKSLDLKIARTVVKMARMTEIVVFLESESQAAAWLDRQ